MEILLLVVGIVLLIAGVAVGFLQSAQATDLKPITRASCLVEKPPIDCLPLPEKPLELVVNVSA